MSYTVIIIKNETTPTKGGHQWSIVSEKPMYPDDPSRAAIKEHVYGYTPQFDTVKEDQRELYKQTVENLDIAALVSVVNSPT